MKSVRQLGVRVGNWLTAEESKKLLGTENADTLRSRRNRALLSLLIGCALREIPVPEWVKEAIDSWTAGAGINAGPTAALDQQGGQNLGTWIYGEGNLGNSEVQRDNLRSADSSSARFATDLCTAMLGHVSIQTTERYLGCKQRLRDAVNDHIGLEPDAPS